MSAIASSLTVAHILPRSPTPSPEITEKHVDLLHPPRSLAPSTSPQPTPDTMTTPPKRRSLGGASEPPEQPPAAPASVPPPLTNLMVPSKTTTAVATTATVTATATATTTVLSTAVPLDPTDLGLGVSDTSIPSTPHEHLAHRPSVQIPPTRSPPPEPITAPPQEVVPAPSTPPIVVPETTPLANPPDQPDETGYLPAKFPKLLSRNASPYPDSRDRDEPHGATLEELAHYVRLSKHQERTRSNTRVRLERSLISTALSARLLRCSQMAHRGLAECFRGDDRSMFANLYNTVHDVRRSCDDMWKYALLGPEMGAFNNPSTPTKASGGAMSLAPTASSSFLQHIPPDAQDAFLSFLTSLRNNPDYLASRLCSLSPSELIAITTFYRGQESTEPVQQIRNRPYAGRGSSFGRSATHGAAAGSQRHELNAVQKFMSFQRHDPLSALIYTCFADSAGPNSTEDRRRTDVWSTACARLISDKGTSGMPVLAAVLDAWTLMRGWAGHSNMEWFLMKILEDGAFLLDRAEDQNGTRFNLNEWTQKDQIAAEEFYDRAVSDLFDVVDDEDSSGIPDGLVELGNQILAKLEPKYVEKTRAWLVWDWLFGIWLFDVIVHPEAYGLMAEYHITEYGRQKILKAVALRVLGFTMDRAVSPGTAKSPKYTVTPPSIQSHLNNILGRFRGSTKPRRAPARLLPARSINSLRETNEIHPYLVVSPADLVTLVNALFPDRQSRSVRSGSIRSGRASTSSFSVPTMAQPIPADIHQRRNLNIYTTLSASVSSANTETTTSGDPLLEDQLTGTSASQSSPPTTSIPSQDQRRSSNYEEDGYQLRLAVRDMVDALGRDVVSGTGHPCGDSWAVVFVSPDGNSLSTHTAYDPRTAFGESTFSSSSDSDEQLDADFGALSDELDLEQDYYQLRDSVLELVEDYEIPQRSAYDSTSIGQRLFYEAGEYDDDEPSQCVLIDMLEAASSQSRAQSDFMSAHQYWTTIQQLNSITTESLRRNGFAALLGIFSRGPRNAIERSTAAMEEYDAWLMWLKQTQEQTESLVETKMSRLQSMRNKMWYVTDVRNSAPYEVSRNVAAALKTMGTTRKWDAYQRARQSLPRGPAASYLYRSENEVVDLLAATESQGGPNKLSDDQVDKTMRWLQNSGIENFCQGEERIHRFCCEVGNCVDQLIGESMVDAPVLWSSELFVKDHTYFEVSGKSGRERDSGSFLWDSTPNSSNYGDMDSHRFNLSSRGSGVGGCLRTTPGPSTPSQLSFDSRYNFSRASTSLTDLLGSQDYLSGGLLSAPPAIDTTTTYWSPFRSTAPGAQGFSRTQSPTSSMHSLPGSFSPFSPNARSSRRSSVSLHSHSHQSTGRPGTSSSSIDMVFAQRISDDKSRFLDNLRRTLTSLLLSDLGNLVFARGSETDSWFSDLGQQCINQREATEKTQQEKPQPVEGAVAKPNSSSPSTPTNPSATSVMEQQTNSPVSRPLTQVEDATDSPNTRSADATKIDDVSATASPSREPQVDTAKVSTSPFEMPDFPFTKAYQRLLRLFCVHPNPFTKMHALFELENLIMASLPSRTVRRRLALSTRRESTAGSSGDASGVNTARAKPLEETIGNVNGRRSTKQAFSPLLASPMSAQRGSFGGGSADPRSAMANRQPSNKDAVSGILKSLFRDPSVRPKTLFRDLQFIASFVPPEVLDGTERGKAFWDAGLAALLLKKEVCDTMVEEAYEIVRVETETRRVSSVPSVPSGAAAKSSDGTFASEPPRPAYTLADAARMWTVTAKEGIPIAQRELGLFYLLYPELVERTTLPLSRPRDVFKKDVMEKYGGSSGGSGRYSSHQAGTSSGRGSSSSGTSGLGSSAAGGPADVRNDAALMCVAIHWMVAAEKGGDESARNFLRQNEMMIAS